MEYTKASFEPTVGDAYSHGWKTLWKYFLELFLIGLLIFIISLPLNAISFLMVFFLDLVNFSNFAEKGLSDCVISLNTAYGIYISVNNLDRSFNSFRIANEISGEESVTIIID